MEHDDYVGAEIECRLVAALLIRTVAPVLVVPDRDEAEALCLFHRVVAARVVHQQDLVDDRTVELADGPLQSLSGVVGRKHRSDLFPVEHAASVAMRWRSSTSPY